MIETGLIYRNPKPHLYSRQAAFPSLVLLPNGELLASFAIGSGFEAADQHTELARSADGGRTWSLAGAVFNERGDRPTSANVRISRVPDGELLAVGVRADRSRADEGLTNPATQGFVETELILLRSSDDGHSWRGPDVVAPPLVGPSFELCSPVVPLSDGRWLWPTSTWKGWDGDSPNGMKAIALVSHDRGLTWPEYVEVMNGVAENVIFWEQKIVDIDDGRLLAVCWTHDLGQGADRPVHYAISKDYGRSFGPPRSTGLHGQTSTPIWLGDGRLLCVYRRTDMPGLWAAYGRIGGDEWINDAQLPLWGYAGAGNMVGGENLSLAFTTLKFGLPAGLPLPDGQVFVAFWCVEECVYTIRWFRIPSQPPAEDGR
jgi:hypothetical protein